MGNCPREVVIVAQVVHYALIQGFDAVAGRVEEFGTEITETAFNHTHKKPVQTPAGDSVFEASPAGVVYETGGLFGSGLQLEVVDEDRVQLRHIGRAPVLKS